MVVLGTWLEKDGSTKPSYQHREAKAEKAFWAESSILLNRAIPLYRRFQRYSERVASRVLHGSGGWTWTQSLCQSLTIWEGKALRRIVAVARKSDENWLRWFRRGTRIGKKMFMKAGFTPLSLRVLREIHRTASSLQRPSERLAASRNTVLLLSDAIQWRDTLWWKEKQALGQVCDPRGALGWKHASNYTR
eukprot:9747590-Karenia_brevis.AAC.1